MALPTDPASSWLSRTGTPSRLFGTDSDYELYEQDGEFVLSVEMPGFASDDIEVGWYEGRLTIAAERTDDRRDETRTYRRSFRMPKQIDDDNIRARYQNGVLDVYLPSIEDATTKGKTVPIES
jgi:HSP20 family protein